MQNNPVTFHTTSVQLWCR